MQKLWTYRSGNKCASGLPCMRTSTELFRNSRRKLLKTKSGCWGREIFSLPFAWSCKNMCFRHFFIIFLDIHTKLCHNESELNIPANPLGSYNRNWRGRKLWRTSINHIGCRRCKADAESLRQKDRSLVSATLWRLSLYFMF